MCVCVCALVYACMCAMYTARGGTKSLPRDFRNRNCIHVMTFELYCYYLATYSVDVMASIRADDEDRGCQATSFEYRLHHHHLPCWTQAPRVFKQFSYKLNHILEGFATLNTSITTNKPSNPCFITLQSG